MIMRSFPFLFAELEEGLIAGYLAVSNRLNLTYFLGHLISRKWKRQISRDLNFAIWQKNCVKRN